jgi:hypothetical protein
MQTHLLLDNILCFTPADIHDIYALLIPVEFYYTSLKKKMCIPLEKKNIHRDISFSYTA